MTRHEAAPVTAEEVEAIRQRSRHDYDGWSPLTPINDIAALLRALDEQAAELARLRRVEAAARAYRDEHDCSFQCETADALRDVLEAARGLENAPAVAGCYEHPDVKPDCERCRRCAAAWDANAKALARYDAALDGSDSDGR